MKENIPKAWYTLGLCPHTDSLTWALLLASRIVPRWWLRASALVPEVLHKVLISHCCQVEKNKSLRLSIPRGAAKATHPYQWCCRALHTPHSNHSGASQPWRSFPVQTSPGIVPKSICVGRVKTTWVAKPLQLSYKPAAFRQIEQNSPFSSAGTWPGAQRSPSPVPWIPPLSQGPSRATHFTPTATCD